MEHIGMYPLDTVKTHMQAAKARKRGVASILVSHQQYKDLTQNHPSFGMNANIQKTHTVWGFITLEIQYVDGKSIGTCASSTLNFRGWKSLVEEWIPRDPKAELVSKAHALFRFQIVWSLVIWIANSFIEQITGALKFLDTEARDLWFCHRGIIQDSKNHKETAISHL